MVKIEIKWEIDSPVAESWRRVVSSLSSNRADHKNHSYTDVHSSKQGNLVWEAYKEFTVSNQASLCMLQWYQKDPGFCEMQCISSTALHHLLLSEPGRYNDAASRGNCWLAHQEGRGTLATTIHERQRKKRNEKHKMNIPIKVQASVSSQCILLSILLRKLFRNVLQCCVELL